MPTYRPHTIKIHPDSIVTAIILTDLTSLDEAIDAEMRAEVTAPNISPTHVAMVGRKPMARGSTYDLPGFLDNVGVSGLAIKSTTNPGIVTYYQKFDDQGPPTGGSVNRSLTYGNGLLVPKTMRVDHQGDVKLDWELYAIGDVSGNAPTTIADNVALPTITQTPNRWTMGGITLSGIALARYRSLEIDFGNEVQVDGTQSALDPTYISVRTHSPKITITGIDPAWFAAAAVPIGGLAVLNATSKIFLRKRAQTGLNFVADGTSEHIKIVPAGLAGITKSAGAEMQRVSETTIVIQGAKDASGNAPIVLTTATTIA